MSGIKIGDKVKALCSFSEKGYVEGTVVKIGVIPPISYVIKEGKNEYTVLESSIVDCNLRIAESYLSLREGYKLTKELQDEIKKLKKELSRYEILDCDGTPCKHGDLVQSMFMTKEYFTLKFGDYEDNGYYQNGWYCENSNITMGVGSLIESGHKRWFRKVEGNGQNQGKH